MKKSMVIILVVTVVLTIGCKEGVYNVGGYNFQIKMPKIALSPTEQPVVDLWLVANPMEPTPAPRIRTSNPLFDIKLGIKPGETIQPVRDVRLFSIVVPDLAIKEPPRILRYLEIPLPSRPLKIIRGSDLGKEFGLFYRGQWLIIKPKEPLTTPVVGKDDLGKVPRIKGTVAQFVAEDFAPITTEEYSIIPQEAPILKVPITISSSSQEEINQLDIGVDWPNRPNYQPIFWLTPGEFFPSPVIETENNIDITPKIFLVQNVEVQTELEILAPSNDLPPIPPILDLLLFYKDEIELGIGNKNIVLKNSIPSSIQNSPKQTTTTWGKIKKN
jgi:hypothetical protein